MATVVSKIQNTMLQPYSTEITNPYQDSLRKARKRKRGQTAMLTRGQNSVRALPIELNTPTASQINQEAAIKGNMLKKISAADTKGTLSFYDFANTTIGTLRQKKRSYAAYLKLAKGTTAEQQQEQTDKMKATGKESSRKKKRSQKIIDMYKEYLRKRKVKKVGRIAELSSNEDISDYIDEASIQETSREG